MVSNQRSRDGSHPNVFGHLLGDGTCSSSSSGGARGGRVIVDRQGRLVLQPLDAVGGGTEGDNEAAIKAFKNAVKVFPALVR